MMVLPPGAAARLAEEAEIQRPARPIVRIMLRARFLAACHALRWLAVLSGEHRIWRVTDHWGFRTSRVFCDCGKEFR